MSMSPSGVVQDQDGMNADISVDTDNIIPEDLDEDDYDIILNDEPEEIEEELSDLLLDYINRAQEKTGKYERELEECDELLQHTARQAESRSSFKPEELKLLQDLASEHGVDPISYRNMVLQEIENDLFILSNGDMNENNDIDINGDTVVDVESANGNLTAETGAVVTIDNIMVLELQMQREFQKMNEKLQLREDEMKQKAEIQKQEDIKQMEVSEKNRQLRQAQLEEEEKLQKQRIMEQEAKLEEEEKSRQQDVNESLRIYQEQITQLEEETKREQAAFDVMKKAEIEKQNKKQNIGAIKIQSVYRGYRARKLYGNEIRVRTEEVRRAREDARIKAVEEEFKLRELERLKVEEEKKRKEIEDKERKRKEAEEVKKREEEERQRREEEERKKNEYEDKQRKEEEERRKAEEERKKRETIEKQETERRKLVEEERARKDEEDRKRKEEADRQKRAEEERKKEEERKIEEQRLEELRKDEERMKLIEKAKLEEQEKQKQAEKEEEEHLKHMKQIQEESTKKLKESDSTKRTSASVDNKFSISALLPDHLEGRRRKWIEDCAPWSKISNEPWKRKVIPSKKPPRRSLSAKKLPVLEESTILTAAHVTILRQVTTVQLQDLPGCNISSLGQCWGLKYLHVTNCGLKFVDGLEKCHDLRYLNLSNNQIEYIDVKGLGKLEVIDLSYNNLTSIHGMDDTSNLRWLDMSHNKITRLGPIGCFRRLHTLNVSHNQLISSQGVGELPTLMWLDVSHNHLQAVDDVKNLCLLHSLKASGNNILVMPDFQNNVLLHELLLDDNSLSHIDVLTSCWLPIMQTLNLGQNSLSMLGSLENCITLKHLDISNNQVIELDDLLNDLSPCVLMESISVHGNPISEDSDSKNKILKILPRLNSWDGDSLGLSIEPPLKPLCGFEAMSVSQGQMLNDLAVRLQQDIRSIENNSPSDLSSICDVYFKYCDKTFQIAVEHRYAHEYGEITLTVPTAPMGPKSSQLNARLRLANRDDQYLSPKEKFEQALLGKTDNAMSANLTSANDNEEKLVCTDSTNGIATKENLPTMKVNASTIGKILALEKESENKEKILHQSATLIQAQWRGYRTRKEIDEYSKLWLAATTIQMAWRGYNKRCIYNQLKSTASYNWLYNRASRQKLDTAATKIQALWRGYCLRCRLQAALDYARLTDDEDDMEFQEIDLGAFEFDESALEDEWRPPSTPQFPQQHAVLRKPPSGRPPNTGDSGIQPRPPSMPREAWRNLVSPLTDRSSRHVILDTNRSTLSKKERLLSDEWGFKDERTAEHMFQRAKKLQYNPQKRKKLSKLDPKQRLALFRKLEESNKVVQVQMPSKRALPRKEYFQARLDSESHVQLEKTNDNQTRITRTYQWLHTQITSNNVANTQNQKPSSSGGDGLLPRLDADITAGRRVQLVSSPSIDIQSVSSVSIAEHVGRPRRFSVEGPRDTGYASEFPPIKTNSAPSNHKKERMSWRTPQVNSSVGWGGGRRSRNNNKR